MILRVDEQGHIAAFEPRATGAAHSMDTDWYAVDANGAVGYLASGEEGAVPWDAHRRYWSELYQELLIVRIVASDPGPFAPAHLLARALPRITNLGERALVAAIAGGDESSRPIYADWLELHRPRPPTIFELGHTLRPIEAHSLPPAWSGIVQFASAELAALFIAEHDHLQEWRVLEPRIGMANALAVTELQDYAFTDYWEQGAITAAYVGGVEVMPRFVGLYEYRCGFSGPYHREGIPAHPLLIEDIPEPLRSALGALRMPIAFATREQLDPQQYAACSVY